jgi:predicted ATPase
MIGANGVGKTAFLEIFSFLAASANGQLNAKFSSLGGLGNIMTLGKANSLAIHLQMNMPDSAPLHYQLKIVPQSMFYEIAVETLIKQRDHNPLESFKYIDSYGSNITYYNPHPMRPSWQHNPLETSLSQVPKIYEDPEILRQKLATIMYYGVLNVATGSPIRFPQPMYPTSLPGSNGESLVSCLYYLRETDPDRFEIIEDTLSAAFPDFERLNFPPVAAGILAMTWKDKNFSQPLYIHQLSEGTLRFLWLVTLLQSPKLTDVTLIDEPEVSLHPELLQLLAHVMREASKRTQLIVATQSDRLIRFLEPKEVLVCDSEDGLTTMTWADSLDIEHWLADYSLDEIWAMNVIGGRP